EFHEDVVRQLLRPVAITCQAKQNGNDSAVVLQEECLESGLGPLRFNVQGCSLPSGHAAQASRCSQAHQGPPFPNLGLRRHNVSQPQNVTSELEYLTAIVSGQKALIEHV